ncbi:MAG: hypothetical protein MH472_07440 [Bacteroidia bacterium]|nr:hypothetical protein [Bacteroidia bacterium]
MLKNESLGLAAALNLPLGASPALLHVPAKQEKGLIISFTGFSMQGYQDVRIAAVNNAFAKMGYRVITPQIATIDALCIHPRAIDEVKQAILSIWSDPILNPNKHKPAIFAPSFTAGIAALAVAELPENTISGMCLLGSFCHFESTIQFALGNPNKTDDYGMHVILKNFLPYEMGDRPELEEILQTALADNGLRRKEPQLPALLQKASKETLELYSQLKTDAGFRQTLIESAYKKIPDFSTWKNRLDLSKHAHKISCKVSIIHGKNDDVIPEAESILLHQLMKPHNPQVRLVVSDLLSHGDPKFGWKIFSELINLARGFAFFLDNSKI